MIDNRTPRQIWEHGYEHVINGRLDDANRCIKRLQSLHKTPETEFYIGHLMCGIINHLGMKIMK